MHFACSHYDTVFRVQQLFRALSGKNESRESSQLVVFDSERPHRCWKGLHLVSLLTLVVD